MHIVDYLLEDVYKVPKEERKAAKNLLYKLYTEAIVPKDVYHFISEGFDKAVIKRALDAVIDDSIQPSFGMTSKKIYNLLEEKTDINNRLVSKEIASAGYVHQLYLYDEDKKFAIFADRELGIHRFIWFNILYGDNPRRHAVIDFTFKDYNV